MAMLAFSHCEKIKISFNLCDILCIKRHWFFQKIRPEWVEIILKNPKGSTLTYPGGLALRVPHYICDPFLFFRV